MATWYIRSEKPLLCSIECAFTGADGCAPGITCEDVLTRQPENQRIFLKEQRICESDSFLS